VDSFERLHIETTASLPRRSWAGLYRGSLGEFLWSLEAFNSPRVVVAVAAVAAVAAVVVGDYFVAKVSQIDGRCAILQKKY